MKHLLKLLILLLALLLPITALSHDIEVDGIYYNINGGTVIVTYKGASYDSYSDEYTGNIIIPESIKHNSLTYRVSSIGANAFYGCTDLTSINIPNTVVTIGNYAFYGCSGLTDITFPNTTVSIGRYAFQYCTGLTSISIPNSVTFIDRFAFFGCRNLTSVDIPSSVTSIGVGTFSDCSSLASITVANDNPHYDSRDNCNAIIESSTNSLISGCNNTVFPNTVTSISEYAFRGCSGLTSVTIPKWVTSIGDHAFYNCAKLNDVYSFIEDPDNISMGISVFYRDPNNYFERTLHVPSHLIDDYELSNWGQYFGSIMEMNLIYAETIALDKPSATMVEGQTLQLEASIMPENVSFTTVSWATSDPGVASVSANGLVTAVGLGSATITAMTTDGSNLSASCTVTVVNQNTDNCLIINDATVLHGDTITIPVRMTNAETIMAFQTDIYLPEGFSIVTNDNNFLISPSNRLTDDHIMVTQQVSNGSVRLVCYTPNAQPIVGNDGDLFYMTIQVPEDAGGNYVIYLSNTRLTTIDFIELRLPDAGGMLTVNTFIPGDVNDSRTVTVTDIVVTVQYIMEQNPEPFIFEAADMNGDGEVTVTDIMLIARQILYPATNAPRCSPVVVQTCDRMGADGITLTPGETRMVSILLDNDIDYNAFQLDLTLPQGLTAKNFALTDRASGHVFDVSALANGKIRALCYSPMLAAINGHKGALFTFEVTASGDIEGGITVDGIELVSSTCQTVILDAFTFGVNCASAVDEISTGKTVVSTDYFNAAGQRLEGPAFGLTIVVTTYSDGTRTTYKLYR